MNGWLRHLLPYGLVRSSQLGGDLERIGLPKALARSLSRRRSTLLKLDHLNLGLLPAGALQQVDWVMDVGANVGDWTANFLDFCPAAKVVCVEPEPTLAAGLRRRFAARPAVTICQAAIGDKPGKAEFKVMEHAVLNSLRQPAVSMQAINPEPFQVKEVIQVDVLPLDAIAPPAGRITLLKIDTQGFEREVLAGARETLRRTDYVILEVNFQPHYEGEAGFFELDTLMQQHGFCIGNYSEPHGGRRQALFADVLYLRKES
jgi:FkbM family methyltransferase